MPKVVDIIKSLYEKVKKSGLLNKGEPLRIMLGTAKESVIGEIVGRFFSHIKIYKAYEVFSSVENFLAAVIEESVDKNLDGRIGV